MIKILLLTDSLALPRTNPEVCELESTYPEILRKNGFDVKQLSVGGATSEDILKQTKYWNAFNPHVVVFHAGIVDCAPRFVSRAEQYVIGKIPFVGKWALNRLNRPIVRKLRKIYYVKKGEFEVNINAIRRAFMNSSFFCIEIIGGEGYEKLLPGVLQQIEEYNDVLRDVDDATFIEYAAKDITMSDFHHLNEKGHMKLAQKILSLVENR